MSSKSPPTKSFSSLSSPKPSSGKSNSSRSSASPSTAFPTNQPHPQPNRQPNQPPSNNRDPQSHQNRRVPAPLLDFDDSVVELTPIPADINECNRDGDSDNDGDNYSASSRSMSNRPSHQSNAGSGEGISLNTASQIMDSTNRSGSQYRGNGLSVGAGGDGGDDENGGGGVSRSNPTSSRGKRSAFRNRPPSSNDGESVMGSPSPSASSPSPSQLPRPPVPSTAGNTATSSPVIARGIVVAAGTPDSAKGTNVPSMSGTFVGSNSASVLPMPPTSADSPSRRNNVADAEPLQTVVHTVVDVVPPEDVYIVQNIRLPRTREERENQRMMDKFQIVIPVLPLPLAYFCAFLCFVAPGLGALFAGCFALCMPRKSVAQRLRQFFFNFGIGILQMGAFLFVFILGYWWSATWGLVIITVARRARQEAPPTPTVTVLVRPPAAGLVRPGFPQSYESNRNL